MEEERRPSSWTTHLLQMPNSTTTEKVPPRLEQNTNNFISSLKFWHKTVIRKLRNPNSSKASGADGISAEVLKNCAPELAPVLPIIQHFANQYNSSSRMENGSCGSCTKKRKEIRQICQTIDQSLSYKLSQKLWRALPLITSESIWTNINFLVTLSMVSIRRGLPLTCSMVEWLHGHPTGSPRCCTGHQQGFWQSLEQWTANQAYCFRHLWRPPQLDLIIFSKRQLSWMDLSRLPGQFLLVCHKAASSDPCFFLYLLMILYHTLTMTFTSFLMTLLSMQLSKLQSNAQAPQTDWIRTCTPLKDGHQTGALLSMQARRRN